MNDDGNMMDVEADIYQLDKAIDDLESHEWFEPKQLHKIDQRIIRLHNLAKKHRNRNLT